MDMSIDIAIASALQCNEIAVIFDEQLQEGNHNGAVLTVIFPRSEESIRYLRGQKLVVRVVGSQNIEGKLYHFVVPSAIPAE
jgi:hypothetical protein